MEPDFSHYYGNLAAGKDYFIEGHILAFWKKIGAGTFSELGPQKLSFSGTYDFLTYQGSVSLAVAVTGTNVGMVNLSGHRAQCTFQADGDDLHVLFENKNLKLNWMQTGIRISGGGLPVDVWIGA